MNRVHILKKNNIYIQFFKTLISKQEMKGEEIKMLNNVANFLGAWRNSEPLEKAGWKIIFRPVFTIEKHGAFIKELLAAIFTKASLLMGWIIKLKIYVALTAAVNPRYTKTQEINKEKKKCDGINWLYITKIFIKKRIGLAG